MTIGELLDLIEELKSDERMLDDQENNPRFKDEKREILRANIERIRATKISEENE